MKKKMVLSMKLPLLFATLLLSASSHAANIIRIDAPVKSAGLWEPIAPTVSDWVAENDPTDCSNWAPASMSAYEGYRLDQTRTCLQEYLKTTQPRKKNSLTGKIIADGEPIYATKTETVTLSQSTQGSRPILNHFTIVTAQVAAAEGCSVARRGFSLTENCNANVLHPGSASERMVKVGNVNGSLRRVMVYKWSKKCQMTLDLNVDGTQVSDLPPAITLTFAGRTFTSPKAEATDNGAYPVIRYMSEVTDMAVCNSLYDAVPAGTTVAVSLD
jgi:hypothetical protein